MELIHSTEGDIILRYKCLKCGKSYTRADSNRRHHRECGQAPRFYCKYCEKKFKRKEHLASHTRKVHKSREYYEKKIRNH